MGYILSINGGPRSRGNTADLVKSAVAGAKEAGNEVEYFDLYKIGNFSGCCSCFGCKGKISYGKCVMNDALTNVLEKSSDADALILGSPIYLGHLSSGFSAFCERLVFQKMTYKVEMPSCNEKYIPVLMIVTSNRPENIYEESGYNKMLDNYVGYFSNYVGPTNLLICADTLQSDRYNEFGWSMFDYDAKRERRDTFFHEYKKQAFDLGKYLIL